MPSLSDKLKRWLIATRAWEIYVLMQKLPEPENDLPSNLDDRIEDAAHVGNLRLYALWPSLNKKLAVLVTSFPHHLHDENGRICSFSGALEDFITFAVPHVR